MLEYHYIPGENNDTICAPITGQGSAAVSIIRISGDKAFSVMDELFVSSKVNQIVDAQPNSVLYGKIIEGQDVLDEVLLSVFKSPHSFTGEDVLEINCHGSVYIQQRLMEILVEKGIRIAQPGEFSLRKFMNGKADLSQTEAIADLISSESKYAHRIAMNQMRGGVSSEIAVLRKKLLNLSSLLELELDFSEEDVEFADRSELDDTLQEIENLARRLSDSFKLGNAVKNGIPVAIVGATNAGKSTLLNRLFNEEKAIVSEIHGTTRDTIEDVLNIEGVNFRFVDTAGLRISNDAIEKIGIERSFEKMAKAQVILYVYDANIITLEEAIKTLNHHLEHIDREEKSIFMLANKSDLIGDSKASVEGVISISAKHNTGIQELKEALLASVDTKRLNEETILTNARHHEALEQSLISLELVRDALQQGISNDLVTIDLRDVLYHLGSISGKISNEEILGNIFGQFCIGK